MCWSFRKQSVKKDEKRSQRKQIMQILFTHLNIHLYIYTSIRYENVRVWVYNVRLRREWVSRRFCTFPNFIVYVETFTVLNISKLIHGIINIINNFFSSGNQSISAHFQSEKLWKLIAKPTIKLKGRKNRICLLISSFSLAPSIYHFFCGHNKSSIYINFNY